jgi:hypothetical protein
VITRLQFEGGNLQPCLGQHIGHIAYAAPDIVDMLTAVVGLHPFGELTVSHNPTKYGLQGKP